MKVLTAIVTNGFILLLPHLVWNAVFASRLPESMRGDAFDKGIPTYMLIAENLLRAIVFLFPLLVTFSFSGTINRWGLSLYIIGSILYFLSWIALMYRPENAWSRSVFGFSAPACTPIIWLIGIGLMAESYYFSLSYAAWHYIIPITLFSLVHTGHSRLAFQNLQK